MAYCLITDIYNGLQESDVIQLSDDNFSGTVGVAVVEAAIEKGTQIIDSFIGQIVALPLSGSPSPLPALNVDLAIYELYTRRMTDVPKIWKEKKDLALEILRNIAEGKSVLNPDPGGQAGGITSAVRKKVFSSDELKKF